MRLACLRRNDLVANVVSKGQKFGFELKSADLKTIRVPQLRSFLGWGGDNRLKTFLAGLYQQGKIHRRSIKSPPPQSPIRRWWMEVE